MSYSHKKPILLHRGRCRKRRPKTFKTAEAAKKRAELNGVKSYDIVAIGNPGAKNRKLMVVEKK